MKVLNTLTRYYHTVRYLRAPQLYGRVVFPVSKPGRVRTEPLDTRLRQSTFLDPVPNKTVMIGPTRFTLLNEAGDLGAASDWNQAGRSSLWLYNLHYFDDLNAETADNRLKWHLTLIERWIAENPFGRGIGWAPYPTSLRIVNWIKWDLRTSLLSREARRSLAIQVRWLRRRLEYHVMGNHLLANGKALIFAGLYFEGREAWSWYRQGVRLFGTQLEEQILGDGGHFERSPMYHAIVLEDLLDLANLCRSYGLAVPRQWVEIVHKMLSWLQIMTHPDGEITFFNDAAIGVAPSPGALHEYAARLGIARSNEEQRSVIHLAESGYVRVRRGPWTLFLDVAPIGPDYQPGHGHADTLSFELSLGNERVFVNSGTVEYESGPRRDRLRGTRAHNTLVVDGVDSSVVWGGFRVAQRARVLSASVLEEHRRVTVTGVHDGYRRLQGDIMHSRTWSVSDSEVRIEDIVTGSGSHRLEVIYRLYPACRATLGEDGARIICANGKTLILSVAEGRATLALEADSYYPEFGIEVPTQVITLTRTVRLPTSIVTHIRCAEQQSVDEVRGFKDEPV